MSWIKKKYYSLRSTKERKVSKDIRKGQVSMVISSFKRLSNVEKIIHEYVNYDLLSQIIVWQNGPEKLILDTDHPKLKIVNADDLGLATRYAVSLLADGETILMQDDDLFFPEESLKIIVNEHLSNPLRTVCVQGKTPHADGTYGKAVKPKIGQKIECEIHLNRLICTQQKMIPHFFTFLFRTELSLDPRTGGGEDIVYSYAITEQTGLKPLAVGVEFTNMPSPHAISREFGNQHVNRTQVMHACKEVMSKDNDLVEDR